MSDQPARKALEKFSRGDLVVPTQVAIDRGILREHELGTVTGFGRSGFGRSGCTVRVKRVDRKSIDSYHMDFWEKSR